MPSSTPLSPRGPVGAVPLAVNALRAWSARQVLAAAAASVLVALVIGVATVLIPNSVFARDIPPVWWNYPVWLLTSLFSGMLLATYVSAQPAGDRGAATVRDASEVEAVDAEERRTSRMGLAGSMLAWFAVGCPVCNKFALLALGYSGAITWFAPVQPFLAIAALLLSGVALVARLRGQVACPVGARPEAAAR